MSTPTVTRLWASEQTTGSARCWCLSCPWERPDVTEHHRPTQGVGPHLDASLPAIHDHIGRTGHRVRLRHEEFRHDRTHQTTVTFRPRTPDALGGTP